LGDLVLGHEDGGHHLRLELLEDGAAVVAVGRPVEAGLGRHDDDRVHEAVDLLDHVLEAFDVGGGEVALVRRRLDLRHRQQAEDLPVIPHRLPVDRERVPAVLLHLLRQRRDRLRRITVRIDRPRCHSADYQTWGQVLQSNI